MFCNGINILTGVRTRAPIASQGLGTSRPKAKRLIVFSRRYAPKNTIRLPPNSGEADTKEERVHSFYMKKNKKY